MSDTKTRSARLGGDLDDRFVEFKDEHDMTVSEAGRTLIREGLAAREEQDQPTRWVDDFLTTSGAVIAVASIFALLLHLFTTLLTSWGLVLALGVLTAAFNAAAIRSRNR